MHTEPTAADNHTGRAGRFEHEVKRAAWVEYRETLDVAGKLPDVFRGAVEPPGFFVAIELGFAREHRPSIVDTLKGNDLTDLVKAERSHHEPKSVAILEQRLKAERLTAKKARRILQALAA